MLARHFSQTAAEEAGMALAVIPAYAAARISGRKFLLPVIAAVLYFAFNSPDPLPVQVLLRTGRICAGILLFAVIMEGLRFRLLLSPVPKAVAGWPVEILTAALLALMVSAAYML